MVTAMVTAMAMATATVKVKREIKLGITRNSKVEL